MAYYSIEINNNHYKYRILRKTGVKSIILRVDENGIIKITLPYSIPDTKAPKYLLKHKRWLEKNLALQKKRKDKYVYLGTNIKIVEINNLNSLKIKFQFKENVLYISYDKKLNLDKQVLFYKWLNIKAKQYIPKKTKEIANKYGFKYNKVSIRNMKTRWGSCSSKKNLSFNLKLMYFKPEIVEYVIVHELCHLKEMNHSSKFWQLVEDIVPNYKTYRKQLKNFIY